MFNFESFLNLPLIWGGIIVVAISLYILLDGFDLGVGILFPFAPTETCQDNMMYSIAPFWDGNETWLVLGGGGLLASFPLAYSIILPALYLPILFMLLALIFRGVAFEFRFKSTGRIKVLWGRAFHFGSLIAAFMQGVILGSIVQGIEVKNNAFAGGTFDWISGFSFTTGIALVCGYVLLSATWLILKTQEQTQAWARKTARYIVLYNIFFMGLYCIWLPLIQPFIFKRWFSWPESIWIWSIPVGCVLITAYLIRTLYHAAEKQPFFLSLLLFLFGLVGVIVSLWPYIVPMEITLAQAAAAPESLSLMLIGVIFILPVILGYTGYCYYVFRGKVSGALMYHG